MPLTKRFLFLGDSHGDLPYVASAVKRARLHGAEIIQLGDFGFIWPGVTRIKQLSEILVEHGVTLRFVDGNHEDHPQLRKHVKTCTGVMIAPRVIYQPRGSVHEYEDGTRFLFCGGAPSIDEESRVVGKSWWPEEVITTAEFEHALSATGPIHVLVTHDAPGYPPGFSAKGTLRYQALQKLSMQRVDALIKRHQPKLHVHGHWHTRATTHRGNTRVEALDCNQLDPGYLEDSVLLWNREQ
jgi:Icc-related predicted phosphoesterase